MQRRLQGTVEREIWTGRAGRLRWIRDGLQIKEWAGTLRRACVRSDWRCDSVEIKEVAAISCRADRVEIQRRRKIGVAVADFEAETDRYSTDVQVGEAIATDDFSAEERFG